MLSSMRWNQFGNTNKAIFKQMEMPSIYFTTMCITLLCMLYACNTCCNTCVMARDHSHSTANVNPNELFHGIPLCFPPSRLAHGKSDPITIGGITRKGLFCSLLCEGSKTAHITLISFPSFAHKTQSQIFRASPTPRGRHHKGPSYNPIRSH